MRKLLVKVTELRKEKKEVSLLKFRSSYLATKAKPGQFIHIRINSPQVLLRRPFSIHRIEKNNVYILFKIRGKGTHSLSQCQKGDVLDIIGPLGNGFRFQPERGEKRLNILVGGGMGIAPLLFLGERLTSSFSFSSKTAKGIFKNTLVFLGVKTKEELLGERMFKRLGLRVIVATEDGSRGYKGDVVRLFKERVSYLSSGKVYACGPLGMVKALKKVLEQFPYLQGEVSLEQFMGCGLGLCLGCVVKTREGFRRVCRDGPVFDIKEVVL